MLILSENIRVYGGAAAGGVMFVFVFFNGAYV